MLSMYLKPTNFCNVGCDHCYLPESVRAEKMVMDDESLRKTARFAREMVAREGHDAVHFIWHGGEPLVLSPSYFVNANRLLEEEFGNAPFTQSIQTSLIPYRDEWADVINTIFGGHIGSSVDFTQRNIKQSPDAYLKLWLAKVASARENGHFVLPGMVPTRHETKRASDIYAWFVENGFRAFNIDRFSRYGSSTIDWPSNKEHAGFLIGLFDETVKRLKASLTAPAINVVAAGIQGVLLGNPGDRWGTQCQKEFLVVEPDGSINTCPDRAKHEKPFSNISDGAGALIASQSRRQWIRVMDVTHKESHCMSCEYRHFCKSGCPVTPNGPVHGQQECSGYKSFLNHVATYIEQAPGDFEMLVDYSHGKLSGLEFCANIMGEANE